MSQVSAHFDHIDPGDIKMHFFKQNPWKAT